MKKANVLIIVLVALFCTAELSAQQPINKPNRIFKKGQKDLFATIGIAPTFIADDGRQILPPFSIGGDYMMGANFSLGASFGHSITQSEKHIFDDGLIGQWRNRYYTFSARAGLHVTKFDNMSIYGGFTFSYHLSKISPMQSGIDDISRHMGIEPTSAKFLPGGFVGFKYALSPKVTFITELGYGVSLFRTGVGFKI